MTLHAHAEARRASTVRTSTVLVESGKARKIRDVRWPSDAHVSRRVEILSTVYRRPS